MQANMLGAILSNLLAVSVFVDVVITYLSPLRVLVLVLLSPVFVEIVDLMPPPLRPWVP